MSALPVHAAGRSRPDPARTTGVVVGTDEPGRGLVVDPVGVVGGESVPADPDAEPDPDAAVGADDSDEPPDDDGLWPVIWIKPTTTSTDANNATTMIPITQRVPVAGRAADIPPVCASPNWCRTRRSPDRDGRLWSLIRLARNTVGAVGWPKRTKEAGPGRPRPAGWIDGGEWPGDR